MWPRRSRKARISSSKANSSARPTSGRTARARGRRRPRSLRGPSAPTSSAGSIATTPSRKRLLPPLRGKLPEGRTRFRTSCGRPKGLPASPGGPFFALCGTVLAGIPAKFRKHNTRATFLLTMCTRRMPSPAFPRNALTSEPVPRSVTVLPNAWRSVMSERPNCRCPLCLIEEKLRTELRDPENHKSHRIVLLSAPHLAPFPTAGDLLLHLQSLNGNSASDSLLFELLEARAQSPGSVADSLFVLLFLPALHSTVRRVRQRYPALSREDTAQQALDALFACLASARLAERHTYLALAIARRVRRSTFEWAAREAKSPLEAPRSEDPRETNSSESAADSFERAALLRHFFGRAVAAGTLTPGELDLLITFKLEGGAENGAFSNAERQRP